MVKIRRIINLYHQTDNPSIRYLSTITGCSRTAVNTIVSKMMEQNLNTDSVNAMSDDELSKLIYPEKKLSRKLNLNCLTLNTMQMN